MSVNNIAKVYSRKKAQMYTTKLDYDTVAVADYTYSGANEYFKNNSVRVVAIDNNFLKCVNVRKYLPSIVDMTLRLALFSKKKIIGRNYLLNTIFFTITAAASYYKIFLVYGEVQKKKNIKSMGQNKKINISKMPVKIAAKLCLTAMNIG